MSRTAKTPRRHQSTQRARQKTTQSTRTARPTPASARGRSGAPALVAPVRAHRRHGHGQSGRAGRTRSKQAPRGVFKGLVIEVSAFAFLGLVAIAGLVAFYAHDLPDTNGLWRPDRLPRHSVIAADGSPIAEAGTRYGAPVRLADMPPHVVQAVLAVEDRNFYHHVGVNPFSVVRALMANIGEGAVVQGGSTITQQLAKNLFLSHDRTLKRKIQEVLLALWLEQKFSKQEILTLYFNRVYFGAGAYGIDAASHQYFGKPASTLALNEAALIAGLLKAPSRYNPEANPGEAGIRARMAVESMVDAGFLSRTEADRAIATPIHLDGDIYRFANYFADEARREARDRLPDVPVNLIIRTTMDPALQSALETAIFKAEHDALFGADKGKTEIAALVMDGSGRVRAMIGGRNYARSQFNRATRARRQPGSAFKPFVYLTAILYGARPEHPILDEKVTVEGWSPDNYKSKFYGEVTLTEALARSLNAATVRLQEWVGRDRVRQTALAMGFEGPFNPDPALALGVDAVTPMELARAYVPFINGGYRVEAHTVESIDSADGDRLYTATQNIWQRAAPDWAIAQTNQMMQAVTAWGTGRAARVDGLSVAGKTGTTQGNRDAWFVGHAAGLVTVVWVGHDDYTPMDNITGGRLPARLWSRIMSEVRDSLAPDESKVRSSSANRQAT